MRSIALLFIAALMATAAVKVEKTSYKGWQNCYRVTNGEVEVIVTGDIGPRVMRYGFVGGQNLFKEFADQMGKSGEKEFQLRGGHRVWKAPEDAVATWAPDNVPVQVTVTVQPASSRLSPWSLRQDCRRKSRWKWPTGSRVTVTHRIHNSTLFPLEFAPWALTMMAPGGTAITGFPSHGQTPAGPRRDESAGHVGLHGFVRPSLAFHAEVHDVAAGSESIGAAKARSL